MDEKIQTRINLQNACLLLYSAQNFFSILGRCFRKVANVVFTVRTETFIAVQGNRKIPYKGKL